MLLRLFEILLPHSGEREYAYDATKSTGRLVEALRRGWTVVSMKHDWRTIFPFEDR